MKKGEHCDTEGFFNPPKWSANEFNPPKWFTDEVSYLRASRQFSRDKDISSLLSDSMHTMHDALSMFFSQARNMIALISALTSAALFLLGLALGQRYGKESVLTLVAACLLLVIPPLCILSASVIRELYRLYVSCVVYAAQIHFAAGCGEHHWFEWICHYLSDPHSMPEEYRKYLPKDQRQGMPRNKSELVRRWMYSKPNVYLYYRRILIILGVVASIIAVVLFVLFLTARFET